MSVQLDVVNVPKKGFLVGHTICLCIWHRKIILNKHVKKFGSFVNNDNENL